MLQIWPADQQSEWDAFVANYATDGGLLQSWAWGRFQEALGNAVYNLTNDTKTIVAQALQLKAGNQWVLSVPRGPVCSATVSDAELQTFFADIKTFARGRDCFLVRLDPAFDADKASVLMAAGANKSKRERNPKQTLTIDLTQSEELLLSAMKSKWRYNIKLAEKKGVTIRFGSSPDEAKVFWSLVEKTTDRQGFASYDLGYFQTMLSALHTGHHAAVAIAEVQGKPVAALLLGYFGQTAYYLHGASDYQQRALMAPHLLQWSAMQDAKAKGYKTYDFWGVSEQEWPGVTRFKQGFAPDKPFTDYVGTYEMSVKRLAYMLYRLRQAIKR